MQNRKQKESSVVNFPGYIKDPITKTIINTNEDDYQRIINQRIALKNQENRWQMLDKRLTVVEQQLKMMKDR